MNAPAAKSDTSHTAHYVNDALYRALMENFSNWQDVARAVTDVAVRDEFRRLIEREARLLDQLRYDDSLGMDAAEGIYWVRSTPGAAAPRREISVMFDDRRRLEDRIYRMRTGFAWSQAPASRTVRLVTNVEVFATARDDTRMLRSNFLISEFWGDETRVLTGWTGHRVVCDGTAWKIQAKQVNLIDCDQSIRNPSIIL